MLPFLTISFQKIAFQIYSNQFFQFTKGQKTLKCLYLPFKKNAGNNKKEVCKTQINMYIEISLTFTEKKWCLGVCQASKNVHSPATR